MALGTSAAWSAPDGKALYKTWCAGCHGPAGLGDGPDAAHYDAKPSSLASADYKRGTTDKAVLKVITKGVPGTPMDAFGKKLDDSERQALVDYLKILRGAK
jgi:high-affinity iron transporter